MDDLPFCLEDLPPEIRDKIDDIIEKNEDLESQLDAIDTLLFANRPQLKSDVGGKFDLGNESGIGSDSDSGHGIVPAQDLLTISPFPSKPQEELVENGKTLGPLLRKPVVNDDMDDFISRIIVPPPPHPTLSTGSHSSSASAGRNISPATQIPPSKDPRFTTARDTTPSTGLHPSITSASVSTAPTSRKSGLFEGNLPVHLPPPPSELEESPIKLAQGHGSPRPGEAITAVRTGQNFLVTVDVPRGAAASSNGNAADLSGSNVTRVQVGKGERQQLPVNVTSVPVSRSVHRQSDATSESSRGRSSSQLYAWNNKSPNLESIREDQPDKPTDPKKSRTLPVQPQRPSELNLSKDKESRFWKKGKEKYASTDLITTPSRYSQVATGPTVELRRKKWRPTSDILSEGVRGGSLDSARQMNRGSAIENSDEDRRGAASDDDFSGLVTRLKNGKPAQNPRIDSRTMKAQSMLSLYDPSSDLKGRSKDKKTTTTTKMKTKLDPFAFFRAKKRNNHADVRRERSSSERTESLDSSASRESVFEPLRSDYLFPVPPPPVFVRSTIPSPSLYASVDLRSSSSISHQTRSPPPPGDISEIRRIDVRDLDAGNLRPPVTFNTFRGDIQPIRWSEERTRFPVSSRWSLWMSEGSNSPGDNPVRSPSALASRCSLPGYLLQSDKSGGGLSSSATREDAAKGQPSPSRRPSQSKASPTVQQRVVARAEGAARQRRSPGMLVVDSNSTPVIKVTPAKVVTPPPEFPRVITPAEPQVFVPSTTSAAGTRLSIASACLSTSIPEECLDDGNSSGKGRSVTPVLLPRPQNQHLTTSHSSPRLDVGKAVPGRLSPRQSFAGSAQPQEPHSRISPCPSVNSVETSVSGQDTDDLDSVSWNGLEELLVLQTTYENEIAGDRAEDDVSRMLSSLEAQRGFLLSADSTSNSRPPLDLFALRKDSLATQSRRLVTEAKLMVSAATRSRHELTSTLTPVVHTVARVFESCRLVLAVLPPGIRRTTLLDQVFDVGRMFLDTLTSANLAAGRRHDDPAMDRLMTNTTALAQALYKLVSTTKSLDDIRV